MNPEKVVTTSAPSRLGAGDAIGISLLCISLMLVSYLRSRHCMFWGDEIMGMELLRQPTYAGLLSFWRHGLDSSGIFFYVFGRPWLAVFGMSEVSLRMYSAAGISASAAILWLAARRRYEMLPVAGAITYIYACLGPLRWQLANGRTYGILMLAVALVTYLQLRSEDDRYDRPSALFLLATFSAYSLLCGSHILAVLYASAMLGTQLMLDFARRRFRPTLYIAASCSLVVVFLSRANLQATAALGKPSFWTVRPTLRSLIGVHLLVGNRVSAAIVFLFLLALLQLRLCKSRQAIYIILGCFAVLDVVFYIISRKFTSIYVDRYFLPFTIALVFALCELFTQVRESEARWPRLRVALPGVFILGAFAVLFIHRLQPDLLPYPDYTAALATALPPGLPIIDTDASSFVEMEFYQHDHLGRSIEFPVDWAIALDPASRGGVSGFHEMDNWRDAGLYSSDIVTTPVALAGKKDFLVLTTREDTLWLQNRIFNNPAYEAKQIGAFTVSPTSGGFIWMVHHQ